MQINVQCTCGQKLRFDDSLFGKKLRCSACKVVRAYSDKDAIRGDKPAPPKSEETDHARAILPIPDEVSESRNHPKNLLPPIGKWTAALRWWLLSEGWLCLSSVACSLVATTLVLLKVLKTEMILQIMWPVVIIQSLNLMIGIVALRGAAAVKRGNAENCWVPTLVAAHHALVILGFAYFAYPRASHLVGSATLLLLGPTFGTLALVGAIFYFAWRRPRDAPSALPAPRSGLFLGIGSTLIFRGLFLVVFATLLTSVREQAREILCATHLRQLWKMEEIYMSQFGGRMYLMPNATGKEFWLALSKTQPPIIDVTDADIYICPDSGLEAKEGVCTYAGPAQKIAKMADGDVVGMCDDEGHGDVVIILHKSGDIMSVPRDGPEHQQAQKTTKR